MDQEGRRRSLLARLDRLYDAGGPTSVYQPVVSLDGLVTVGVEALSRFPTGNPAEWFAAADEAGAGTELELRAIRRAVEVLPELPGFLALNVSPQTVRSPGFARVIDGLPLNRLVLELTEHWPGRHWPRR